MQKGGTGPAEEGRGREKRGRAPRHRDELAVFFVKINAQLRKTDCNDIVIRTNGSFSVPLSKEGDELVLI